MTIIIKYPKIGFSFWGGNYFFTSSLFFFTGPLPEMRYAFRGETYKYKNKKLFLKDQRHNYFKDRGRLSIFSLHLFKLNYDFLKKVHI